MKKVNITNKSLIANQKKLATPFKIFSDIPEDRLRFYYTPISEGYYFIGEVGVIMGKKYNIFLEKNYAGTKKFFNKSDIPCTFEEAVSLWPDNVSNGDSKTLIESNKNYINSCIKQKREYFLASIVITVETDVEGPEQDILKGLPIVLASMTNLELKTLLNGDEQDLAAKFFEGVLWQEIDSYEPFRLMSYDKYQDTIKSISEFINNVLLKECSKKEKLRMLTNLIKYQNFDNPFTQEISSFIDDIYKLLEMKGEIKRCMPCGNPFAPEVRILYCSDKCGKSAQNHRGYWKDPVEARRKVRERVREQRQALKQYEVIKLTKKEQLKRAKIARVVDKIEQKIVGGGVLKK